MVRLFRLYCDRTFSWGLLAKSILDVFPPSKMRILCTLATPGKAPDAVQHSEIRGWVSQKRYYAELSRLYSWSYEGTIELFRTYHASFYAIYALASLYDSIVGDPFYQCPYERPTAYQMSTHLIMPFDHPAIAYIVNVIPKHSIKIAPIVMHSECFT